MDNWPSFDPESLPDLGHPYQDIGNSASSRNTRNLRDGLTREIGHGHSQRRNYENYLNGPAFNDRSTQGNYGANILRHKQYRDSLHADVAHPGNFFAGPRVTSGLGRRTANVDNSGINPKYRIGQVRRHTGFSDATASVVGSPFKGQVDSVRYLGNRLTAVPRNEEYLGIGNFDFDAAKRDSDYSAIPGSQPDRTIAVIGRAWGSGFAREWQASAADRAASGSGIAASARQGVRTAVQEGQASFTQSANSQGAGSAGKTYAYSRHVPYTGIQVVGLSAPSFAPHSLPATVVRDKYDYQVQ